MPDLGPEFTGILRSLTRFILPLPRWYFSQGTEANTLLLPAG